MTKKQLRFIIKHGETLTVNKKKYDVKRFELDSISSLEADRIIRMLLSNEAAESNQRISETFQYSDPELSERYIQVANGYWKEAKKIAREIILPESLLIL